MSFKAQAYNCESVGETQLSRLDSSHLLFLIHGRFSVNYLQATFILNLHQHCLPAFFHLQFLVIYFVFSLYAILSEQCFSVL